jgi:hypothetical protein
MAGIIILSSRRSSNFSCHWAQDLFAGKYIGMPKSMERYYIIVNNEQV